MGLDLVVHYDRDLNVKIKIEYQLWHIFFHVVYSLRCWNMVAHRIDLIGDNSQILDRGKRDKVEFL